MQSVSKRYFPASCRCEKRTFCTRCMKNSFTHVGYENVGLQETDTQITINAIVVNNSLQSRIYRMTDRQSLRVQVTIGSRFSFSLKWFTIQCGYFKLFLALCEIVIYLTIKTANSNKSQLARAAIHSCWNFLFFPEVNTTVFTCTMEITKKTRKKNMKNNVNESTKKLN